ncbi:uncharacterized protein LOC142226645 [Haematobia irritans]|uniref:uncharacterized protein LOC142226645 n=1 Tax=Haematobia irritans TaxID=7368 RepID=UPI003F507777
MGHRFSKTAANNIATTAGQQPMAQTELSNQTPTTTINTSQQHQPLTLATTTTQRIPIPGVVASTNSSNSSSGGCNNNINSNFLGPTINLQIQESPSGIQSQATGIIGSSSGATITCIPNTSTTNLAPGILSPQSSSSNSLTSVNNLSCGRQIIIKIQLAKMENGNDISSTTSTSPEAHNHHHQRQDVSLEALTADCNLNSSELMAANTTTSSVSSSSSTVGAQILNVTLNSNGHSNSIMTNGSTTIATTPPTTTRTAGSSTLSMTVPTTNNNYLNPSAANNSANCTTMAASSSSMDALRERLGRLDTLQFNNEIVDQNIGDIVEYCEVLEDQIQPTTTSTAQMLSLTEEPEVEVNVCCRRKSKSLAANGGASSSAMKRRCRKCSCRDAFRRILDPSLSRSSNKAQKQQQQQQQQQLLERERKEQKYNNRTLERHSVPNVPTTSNRLVNALQMQRNSMHSSPLAATSSRPSFVVSNPSSNAISSPSNAGRTTIWSSPNGAASTATTTTSSNDVIIPLTTTQPQVVVVQCAIVNSSGATTTNTTITSTSHHQQSHNPNSLIEIQSNSNNNNNNSIISISHNRNNDITIPKVSHASLLSSTSSPSSAPSQLSVEVTVNPIVHSQVDFVHYLVPDLERITSSSFYWGKMDRYEAERLLEDKPEGTFLLRDSAQEEFLFSVTFRKYGRSLHARIEQSGHRFSFDCHDPCVYTAPTVTGLLEHYKDPACVMFFEPMLTIPLHRKNCFSLQQLCRATIVSHTTYDGINELELPARLKSYLKEYHYKQKLRVKSNEFTYNPTTANCK